MQKNCVLIVICAVLCNIATSKRWHGHRSYNPGCHHHSNEWHTGPGSSSSSSEDYDWPYHMISHHHQHGGNNYNPWGLDLNQYPHHINDWADNSYEKHWAIFQRSTPSTSTSLPNRETDFSNPPTPFSSEPTVFPSQPTLFSTKPTIFPNQPSLAPNIPTVSPNRPTQSPSEPTINPNLPPLSENQVVDPNPTTTVPSPSVPSTGRTLSEVENCQRFCSVTPEYDPVCGTNYETYTNMGRFNCARNCGVDVQIFLRRRCPSIGVGTLKSTKVQCIASCPITEENNPVCGSDDITYDNPSKLLCAQMCGYNVMVKSMTSCLQVATTRSPNLRLTSSIPYSVKLCTDSCASSTEFKPVCGNNDVTYQSQSHLECAKLCGIEVEIKYKAPCGQVNNNDNNNPSIPSFNDQRVTTVPPNIQMCVNSCPVTAELNPVCGTNGITYSNPSQLECDRSCGIRVEILQRSPCSQDTSSNQTPSTTPISTTSTLSPLLLASCIRACPQTPEYNPVCGTNGVTYNNPSHLGCAQTCGASVDIRRRSACRPTVTQSPMDNQPSPITNPPLQTIKEPTENLNNDPVNTTNIPNVNNGNKPTDSKDRTTLSPAALSIFTDAPTTTTEKDEFVDFDTRFGEDENSKK